MMTAPTFFLGLCYNTSIILNQSDAFPKRVLMVLIFRLCLKLIYPSTRPSGFAQDKLAGQGPKVASLKFFSSTLK